jgi:hypothetical protein
VRLHAKHLHIYCRLFPCWEGDGDEDDLMPREDAVWTMERLGRMMNVPWPEVVEVRVPAERSLPAACHGHWRAPCYPTVASAGRALAPSPAPPADTAVQVTICISNEATVVPLSLVLRGLPALQRLKVLGSGAGQGLGDACITIASLGTRLKAVDIFGLLAVDDYDVSTAVAPLSSLTGKPASCACLAAGIGVRLPLPADRAPRGVGHAAAASGHLHAPGVACLPRLPAALRLALLQPLGTCAAHVRVHKLRVHHPFHLALAPAWPPCFGPLHVPPPPPAAGLEALDLMMDQGLQEPLDALLAPLSRLTRLKLMFERSLAPPEPLPLPASLAQLTALRQLSLTGLAPPAQQEVALSVLAPLAHLTELSMRVVVGGSCRVPDLPSLQSLSVETLEAGGLALLAAACPALVSLISHDCITVNAADAAARLPALISLKFWGDLDVSGCPRAAAFSLAGCAPALQSIRVCSSQGTWDPLAAVGNLRGLSELYFLPATGQPAVAMGARKWQALAALPALRSFSTALQLGDGRALPACVSFCAQLTRLILRLTPSAPQVRRCVEFAAAMRASRVQEFTVLWGSPRQAWPELPTAFFEHLAGWSCLSRVSIRADWKTQHLSALCTSPTLTRVEVWTGAPPVLNAVFSDGIDHLAVCAAHLMQAPQGAARELEIILER